MLRLRLASLALASGLMFTLSGCCSFCEDGKFTFPRLFRSNSSSRIFGHGDGAECECHGSHLTGMMDAASMSGPGITMPAASSQAVPIPITNIPANQPPQIFKVPQASPTPYVPAH